ncbi:MAG TPA: WYL domain-containing transcriptional regulator [Pyrinomonadaceae bacterium]|nr:WYL domain-containing transcriptional regulator [Pyrinomonadaceae bacterium]
MNTHTKRSFRVYHNSTVRITKIAKEIGSNKYPSVAQLATMLEVTERTIKRDLDLMRNELGAPIKHDKKRRGFYFTSPGWTLPPIKMSEGDILAFLLAEHLLQKSGHEPYAKLLKESLSKLSTFLPEYISVNIATLGEQVRFERSPFVEVDLGVLQLVAQSATEQVSLEFDYYSPHNQQKTHRVADVHLLHNFAGDWFAISFDHDRNDFRDFLVGRMSNVKKTDQEFQRQPDFDPENYLRRGFGMMRGGKLTTVVIEIDAYRAQWLKERGPMHPDEVREELADGSLRITFKIGENGLDAVVRHCLTYAGHCKIKSPQKMVNMYVERLKKALEAHS